MDIICYSRTKLYSSISARVLLLLNLQLFHVLDEGFLVHLAHD